MSIDEEYLDNLLNSMKDSSRQETDALQGTDDGQEAFLQEEEPVQEKTIIADIDSESGQISEEEPADEEAPAYEENTASEEAPAYEEESASEKASADEEDESWKTSLDKLLAAADTAAEESVQQESQQDEDFNKLLSAVGTGFESSADGISQDMDVTQMIGSMGSSDDNLAEIRDLLIKSDNNEAVAGDMPVFTSGLPEEELTTGIGKKEKGKAIFSFLKKRKKKKQKPESLSDEAVGTVQNDEDMWEKLIPEEDSMKEEKAAEEEAAATEEPEIEEDSAMEESAAKVPDGKAGGRKGFLDVFFEAIFGEDEEAEQKLDENGEILKELESEDADAKKKEKKKKEKADKKKGKTGGKKEKKPKPEKAKKKPEASAAEPGRPINPRFLVVLVAFCATIIAAVNLLSIFLTDYADKQNARNAFYAGEYEDVYLFLYNKSLNQEENLIYNRANTVLQLQRRLDSYHYNKKLGKEAEALNSLLLGVDGYEELTAGETYGTLDELASVYQNILNCLVTDYGVSEDAAAEINAYDSEAYTQKIYALINGTDVTQESSEGTEPEFTEPLDILPDEVDIISMEMP